jgi:hypothetical protein
VGGVGRCPVPPTGLGRMAGALFVGTAEGLVIYREVRGEWLRGEAHLAGRAVRAIVAADAETLLVAAEGLPAQESFDGGAHWMNAAGAPPEPLGLRVATTAGPIELANPRLQGASAYARLGGQRPTLIGAGAGGAMIFLSNDDGIHWAPAAIAGAAAGRIAAICPDAARPGAAWAGGSTGVLLRSLDRGRSWAEVAHEPAPILALASTGH